MIISHSYQTFTQFPSPSLSVSVTRFCDGVGVASRVTERDVVVSLAVFNVYCKYSTVGVVALCNVVISIVTVVFVVVAVVVVMEKDV